MQLEQQVLEEQVAEVVPVVVAEVVVELEQDLHQDLEQHTELASQVVSSAVQNQECQEILQLVKQILVLGTQLLDQERMQTVPSKVLLVYQLLWQALQCPGVQDQHYV